MIRVRISMVGLLFLVWTGVGALPPAPGAAGWTSLSAQGTNFTVEGKITRHSPGKLTLSTEQNIIFHVRYDEKTEIKRKDGSAGSAKDFRVGLKVMVEGDLTETGEIIALKIALEQDASQ